MYIEKRSTFRNINQKSQFNSQYSNAAENGEMVKMDDFIIYSKKAPFYRKLDNFNHLNVIFLCFNEKMVNFIIYSKIIHSLRN